jgi:hypothetical protein
MRIFSTSTVTVDDEITLFCWSGIEDNNFLALLKVVTVEVQETVKAPLIAGHPVK